jgi:hypothetical protein
LPGVGWLSRGWPAFLLIRNEVYYMDYSIVSIDTTKIFIFASTIVGLLAVIWVVKKVIHTITYS